jgi:hypothetical protein
MWKTTGFADRSVLIIHILSLCIACNEIISYKQNKHGNLRLHVIIIIEFFIDVVFGDLF